MHRICLHFIILLVARAVVAAPVLQATGDGAPFPYALSLGGSYRLSTTQLFDDVRIDLDGDGNASAAETYGQEQMTEHRLRFEPELILFDSVSFYADLQLASGFLTVTGPRGADAFADAYARLAQAGEWRTSAAEAFGDGQRYRDQLRVRKLYVDWRTPVGAFIAGRMASSWGLGILANAGDDDEQDWGAARFGSDRNYGDIVNRVVLATAPFVAFSGAAWARRWTLALGADIVERDERISRSQGDDATETIVAFRFQDGRREAGLYIAYRDLEDRNDDTLEVLALDAAGRWDWRLADFEVTAAGEIVFVTGDTTLARNNAFTGKIDVRQLGYVARGGATYLPLGIGGDLEVGYASGDSNPVDGELRSFSFDPSYNPSLILFDELRAAETIAARANASDLSRIGLPPDSARLLPTQGAVTNAIYVRPTLRYRWNELEARVALLWARSEEDVVDPVTLNAWSRARNHQGGDSSARDLGVEIDAGVDYSYRVGRWAEAVVGIQGGRLFPGEAFVNGDGEEHPAINALFARLLVRWLPPGDAAAGETQTGD